MKRWEKRLARDGTIWEAIQPEDGISFHHEARSALAVALPETATAAAMRKLPSDATRKSCGTWVGFMRQRGRMNPIEISAGLDVRSMVTRPKHPTLVLE